MLRGDTAPAAEIQLDVFLSVGGRPTKNVSVTVSAPSIWNSLSYKCRSAELLSAFKRTLKTEMFDIAYSEREHSAKSLPLCASDSPATYGAVQMCFDLI